MTNQKAAGARRLGSGRPAAWFLFGVVTLGAFAPFLSSSQPITLVLRGARRWPLFASLSAIDILWPMALLSATCLWLGRSRPGRWPKVVAGVLLTMGLLTASLHDKRSDPRLYHRERSFRWEIAQLDEDYQEATIDSAAMRHQLDRLSLQAGALREVSLAIEDRLIALDEGVDMGPLAQDNAAVLKDLSNAIFTLNPHGPGSSDLAHRNLRAGDSADHLLGTDPRGRDLLAGLIHGTRTAFTIAIPVVLITMLVGLLVGGLAGLKGGLADIVLSRLIELVMCLPVLVLLVLFSTWMPAGPTPMIIVLCAVFWTHPARLVRAEARRVAREDFVAAAFALGASTWHILLHHIIPHAMKPLIVSAAFTLGWTILVESSLTFLGLGQAGTASWGELLMLARSDLGGASHVALWAGGVLFAVVLAANTLTGGKTRSTL